MADVPAALAVRDRDDLPGLEPERTITDWGRSERVADLADRTLLGFLYHYWFRVEVDGAEHVPAQGGALLVANRAGGPPLDAAMIAKAVREELRSPRTVSFATERAHAGLPGIGMVLTKLGVVQAHGANLQRLLFDERELVLVFPEGERAAGKPLRWRYRVRPFDSAPFVTAAARAGVPIVPVVVLGAEEATPSLGTLSALGGRARIPLTAGLPLPAKHRIRFLAPVPTDAVGAAAADPAAAEELSRRIRALIQENLLELVADRRSVWTG